MPFLKENEKNHAILKKMVETLVFVSLSLSFNLH